MKATSLLEQQHRQVEAIFKKLKSDKGSAPALLKELANALAAHMAIEQDIFYPSVREMDEDLVNESFEEHAIAEVSLKRLLRTAPSDETFQARVTTLSELIEHHVGEEEEELFPKVEKALGPEKLERLGAQMQSAFTAASAQGFEALVPAGFTQTSSDVARKTLEAQATESASNGGVSVSR